MGDFLTLENGPLSLTLCRPGTFYRGTRFDWCGVFRRIVCGGREVAGLWFDGNDPLRHDNVCGCSEEYAPVWIDGMHCVKVGVGVLEVPEGKGGYDRFKLYGITDGGRFSVGETPGKITFRHTLDGFYEYEKTVSAAGDCAFSIGRSLRWTFGKDAQTDCYNHNFFTFGRERVDSDRRIVLPGVPTGDWREDSVNGYLSGNELRFEREMRPGEKCFIGNLVLPGEAGRPYGFSVEDSDLKVEVGCDAPMEHAVFWSNHRVACLEPYVTMPLSSGASVGFAIRYRVTARRA